MARFSDYVQGDGIDLVPADVESFGGIGQTHPGNREAQQDRPAAPNRGASTRECTAELLLDNFLVAAGGLEVQSRIAEMQSDPVADGRKFDDSGSDSIIG